MINMCYDVIKQSEINKMTEKILKNLKVEGYSIRHLDGGKIILNTTEEGSSETFVINIEKLC